MVEFAYRTVLLNGAHVGTIRPSYARGKNGKQTMSSYYVDMFDGRQLSHKTMKGLQELVVEQYGA